MSAFQYVSTAEIKGEQVLGAVFQHLRKLAATTALAVVARLANPDDATRRRTGKSSDGRNHTEGRDAAPTPRATSAPPSSASNASSMVSMRR